MVSARSARRGDARQSALPSMRAQVRRDGRAESHEHAGSGRPLQTSGRSPRCEPDGAKPTPADRGPSRRSRRPDQIGAFYAQHAAGLRRIVASRVDSDAHTLDDACSYAWERLVGSDEIALDRRGLAWLATVATREGWRLAALVRR